MTVILSLLVYAGGREPVLPLKEVEGVPYP